VAVSDVDVEQDQSGYAMRVADESYEWYKSRAIRSRRRYRATEIAVLIMSGAIPVAVAIRPGTTALTAVLGASVAVISGLDSVFHWQDNYMRYSQAREAVEAERRRYRIAEGRYKRPETRDKRLVLEITKIEQDEMGRWLRLTTPDIEG
jgi:hypothetical protein